MDLITLLQILQIVLSVGIVGLVLMQGKGAGLSASVGSSIGYYGSRRGVERIVFAMTIVLIVALVLNSTVITLSS